MPAQFDFATLGNWELVFSQVLQGDIQRWKRRPKLAAIAPVDLPIQFTSRVFVITAVNLQLTYYRAGTLMCEVGGLPFQDAPVYGGNAEPTTGAIVDKRQILLNTNELVIFPRYSSNLYLTFEPMPWIDRLTLYLWQYTGGDSDAVEEKVDAMRAQLSTVEFKVDQIRSSL